ncbi:MAG: hypothetical protein IPM16_23055 [Chloroflexi bacterium]|nr:hypothetical protein [Chloroflexota bacterium]
MAQSSATDNNALHDLGYKIFLDRYALKDMTRASLAVGDTVIVVVDSKTGQREVGTVTEIDLPSVTVKLLDGETVTRDLEHVDKPLEIQPGQMMDRVARGIADIETTDAAKAEWAKKFRWLLDGWKFVPGGRILAGAGTDQQLTYYNCMPPEQEILTADGYRPIAEVSVGDMVVTHRNRLRKVLHKFERQTQEPLYTFSMRKLGFDDLRVTGDHKVLVIRSETVNRHRSRDGLRLGEEPQWIPAKDLRVGDFLAAAYNGDVSGQDVLYVSNYVGREDYPGRPAGSAYEVRDGWLNKPRVQPDGTKVIGKPTAAIRDALVIDEPLMELFGRWLGDGCVTHRTGTKTPSGIKIVFGLDEQVDAEAIAAIIEDKFGIAPSIKISSTGRWLDLWVNAMPVGEFFAGLFGRYSHGKTIPADLMRQPDNLITALLRGLFRADGYTSGQYVGILLSNRALAVQVHQLLLRLGYFFSIFENTHENGRTEAFRVTAGLGEARDLYENFFDRSAPDARGFRSHLEYDGLKWVRIETITTSIYSGTVMDIEVEEDHSFVSAGVVVSNCYVVPSPRDSRGGIMETLSQMTEIMSRGGGVGINISSLRPRHAYVKGVNGRSSGAVSWGALYSFVTGLIEQGGSRRGALMLILNDWHPDVFNFISSKRQAGQITNANISVGVSDKLMDAIKDDGDWVLQFPDTSDPAYDAEWDGNLEKWLEAGRKTHVYRTVKAREIWNAIIESAWASAEPGVWFRERSNKLANSWYFNPLISTNPCFTGDTRIHTTEGLVKAHDLWDDETDIGVAVDSRFGIESRSLAASRVFMTGVKPVFKLQTDEGYSVRATADHRFMTPRGWVELRDLKPGDHVHVMNRKGTFGRQGSLELGRVLGWLVGDGTLKADRAVLSFFGEEKRELAPLFAEHVNTVVQGVGTRTTRTYPVGVVEVADRDEARVQSERLRQLAEEYGLTEDKFQVPEVVFRGTEEMQRGFLQALFTADGSVQHASGMAHIRLASSHVALLEQVQVVLANFGIASRIFRNRRKAQYRMMPDGKGGSKAYWTRAQHELAITKSNLATFADEIGFLTGAKQDRLASRLAGYSKGPRTESFVAKVASVMPDGEEAVFDLNEPVTHAIPVNGIITHNCGEQPLGAFSVCNLGAINLAKFYDGENHDVAWDDLASTVRYAVRFLDNVIDSTPYFFEENARVQGMERRVGLGTMGIAELMIHLEVRYGSPESEDFIDKLYKFICVNAYDESVEIAKTKGPFSAFDAEKFLQSGFIQTLPDELREKIRTHGIRNVTLLTQAPTGTTGTLVNTSTGIEPFFSWVYYRKSRLGLHEEKVPIVQQWLDANPDMTDKDLPEYFATAMDLTPEEHVRVQAAFQRWIDSAISKTCNVPNEYTVEQVSELYKLMYELGCKGGTIYRDGSRDEQVLMLKGDERAEKEMEKRAKSDGVPAAAEAIAALTTPVTQVTTPHRVYPRPGKLFGVTVKVATPFGTAYVNMNVDENGNPFEVFITAPGKAGSDLQADAEGLGRLITLSLRTTDPHNRREMLRLIIEQLRDIGGARVSGFGPNRVTSLPDAVARALEDHFFNVPQPAQLSLPLGHESGGEHAPVKLPPVTGAGAAPEDEPAPVLAFEQGPDGEQPQGYTNGHKLMGADMCPSCHTISLIRTEGCRKCLTCGYSEC